jgi:hypothetical protein
MPESTVCTQVVRNNSQAAVQARLPCTSWEIVLLAQVVSFQFLKYSSCARDGSLAGSLLTRRLQRKTSVENPVSHASRKTSPLMFTVDMSD